MDVPILREIELVRKVTKYVPLSIAYQEKGPGVIEVKIIRLVRNHLAEN